MPIAITTLNNEAAVAKTFTEISKDKSTSEWLNTTDYTTGFENRLKISQQLIPANKRNPVALRRVLVRCNARAPMITLDANGGTHIGGYEEIQASLVLSLPEQLLQLTTTNRNDVVAYIRNFVTAAVVAQLHQGQV